MITRLFVLLILVAVNAFFAASEIALISLNDNKIKRLAEEGDKKAVQLIRLLEEPSGFLATIQIGITLAGFLASAFAAESFADPVVNRLMTLNLPVTEPWLRITTVVVITVVLAYFTLVFGELVPKRLAMKKSEGIAYFVVSPLTGLSKLTSPVVRFLTFSTNLFLRVFGVDPNSTDEAVTEEEIRMMVDLGQENGTINLREKVMINRIFEFNDRMAEEVMTHRMNIVGIPNDVTLKGLFSLIKDGQFSRYPVYNEHIDNILGILHVKDLLKLVYEEKMDDFNITTLMRNPIYVPQKERIDKLFMAMQLAQTHIAVVLDEYGGTAGIVTLEDLMEEIFGEILDEYDKDAYKMFEKIDQNTYRVSGMISLYELEGYLKVGLPLNEHDTLNGFLIGLLGAIPSEGDIREVDFNGLRFRVVDASEKRIEKVIIKVI